MAGFSLDNMKVMGDLLKFIDKFDAKGNSIEESFKNVSKSMRDMAGSAKAMDSSFGGSTGNVGNGASGSVMSQPPMPGGGGGGGGSPFTSGTAFQNARNAYGGTNDQVQAIGIRPTSAQSGNDFISNVFNGIAGKFIKQGMLLGYNALPSVEQAFQMNTSKQRMSFLGLGGAGGSLANKDAAFTQLLLGSAGAGTGLGLEDILGGFEGSRGLGANAGRIGRNLSIASNITPGVGFTGAAQALTGLNAPRNVNMLRMLGINVRDAATGDMREIDKIIDDLWSTISRQARGKAAITVNDLRLSLQPGNALASMLDQYFGNDAYLRTIVEDGLYAKAQGASVSDKVSLQRIGATTQAIASKASREAASAAMVEKASGPMMFGFEKANQLSTALSNLMGSAFFGKSPFSFAGRGLSGTKGFLDTFAGIGNESGSYMLGQLGQLLGKIPFLAGGGDVAGRNAYVVGEKGPELFVPESDGYIVPHHELDLNNLQFRGGRHSGGKVTTQGPDGSHGHPDIAQGQFHKHRDRGAQMDPGKLREILFAAGFRNGMKGKGGVTINAIDDAMQIIGKESARMPGSANFDGELDMSYGLFQINMLNSGRYKNMGNERLKKFGLRYDWDLYDPLTNAKVAYAISSQGKKWHPAWATAKSVGLDGPYGNPRGGGGMGGAAGDWLEGMFNKATDKTGVFGTVAGAVGGAAGAGAGKVGDFLSGVQGIAGIGNQLQGFVNEILKLFKQFMPDLGARAAGGAVTATGVNSGRSANNYGGVTINIKSEANWDERRLAQEIRKTLEYDVLIKKAVSS
jgi:hypothetical protein